MPKQRDQTSANRCPQCGERLWAQDRFCPACGARTAIADSDDAPDRSEPLPRPADPGPPEGAPTVDQIEEP